MNYRTNEDKLCNDPVCNYNHIWLVEDTSADSGEVELPVTVDEVKKYLRLEGFAGDNSGIAVQEPISLTLLAATTTVQSGLLIGNVIVNLTREGQTHTEADTPGNLTFSFDTATGIITFATAGEVGGETISIVYGVPTGAATVDDFDYDDDLISRLIVEGAKWVETYTGVIIGRKSLNVWLSNGAGMIAIPGPVVSDPTDSEAATLEFIGDSFRKLVTTFNNRRKLTYNAGYDSQTIPAGLKNAVLAYIADHYEYRGDDAPPAANKRAAQKARPYIRGSAWG